MAKLEGCLKPRICNFRFSFSDRFIPYCKSPETGCHNGNPTVTSIDSPPSTPPADVTRALARLFAAIWEDRHCDEFGPMIIGPGLEVGLFDGSDMENERLDLSELGRAALSIAEGE